MMPSPDPAKNPFTNDQKENATTLGSNFVKVWKGPAGHSDLNGLSSFISSARRGDGRRLSAKGGGQMTGKMEGDFRLEGEIAHSLRPLRESTEPDT
jgi:hypothetical protein